MKPHPKKLLDTLIASRNIVSKPELIANELLINKDLIGEWILLISEFGNYWALSVIESGIPQGVLVFSSKTGKVVNDKDLLKRLSTTDSSLKSLDFEYINKINTQGEEDSTLKVENVVEVQIGSSWNDYRPARPEDFVGRKLIQKQILDNLNSISENKSPRVFAIKGASGVGKSSLIAKIRDRSRKGKYKKNLFIFAVDVRAAKTPQYILEAMLACLKEAAKNGFGTSNSIDLRITNPVNPLSSQNIQNYLSSLHKKNQVVCLILDQFEELYSKPDLITIFDKAKDLMHAVISQNSNFSLGFAWKTDSTIQQDHPAYHMWHQLRDHRLEIELKGFNDRESGNVISLLEKELGEKIRPDLRSHLITNSQGFPWLLKKLCIHIYEQIKSGINQLDLIEKNLDIKTLFDRDLQELNQREAFCLREIATNAPADYYDIIQISGQENLNTLIDKRLVIRSGDRLNLYWDNFRDYVLDKKIPSIPLLYIPVSPSIKSFFNIAKLLKQDEGMSYNDLASLASLSEKTIMNIVSDLVIFGIANRKKSKVYLDEQIEYFDEKAILQRIKEIFKRHVILDQLAENKGLIIEQQDLIRMLKNIFSSSTDRERTWLQKALRLTNWLCVLGYLAKEWNYWEFDDSREVKPELINQQGSRATKTIFIAPTSPAITIATYKWISKRDKVSFEEIKKAGFRGGFEALNYFSILQNIGNHYSIIHEDKDDPKKKVFEAARRDETIIEVKKLLITNQNASGKEIGSFLNSKHNRKWAAASITRTGNAIKIWAKWIIAGISEDNIPDPPRGRYKENNKNQATFL